MRTLLNNYSFEVKDLMSNSTMKLLLSLHSTDDVVYFLMLDFLGLEKLEIELEGGGWSWDPIIFISMLTCEAGFVRMPRLTDISFIVPSRYKKHPGKFTSRNII